jgi:hypothetical protein
MAESIASLDWILPPKETILWHLTKYKVQGGFAVSEAACAGIPRNKFGSMSQQVQVGVVNEEIYGVTKMIMLWYYHYN